jgi:DNA-binding NarL/FixJ family response regulator
VLGVDDFALRRNRHYGTVLIDMDTHRPVDVLADREADTVAAWLREHPGTKVVCRDRAGAYAEGARAGAPEAIQVADRWHLWHNLAEQVEKTVAAHHGCLREQEIPPEVLAAAANADLVAAAEAVHAARRASSGLVARSTARFERVQALKAQGKGIKTIMRELGLAKETVRKFYRATSVEEVTATARAGRPSMLNEFKPYLHERFNAGLTNVSALFREIREQGYRGSRGTLADYLAPFRAVGAAPAPQPAAPKVRHVTSWMLHTPRTSTTSNASSSSRSAPPARTWTPPPVMSAPSPRSSPGGAASSWTHGRTPSRPTTCPICTGSCAACAATTTRSSTDSPSRTAQARWKATSTASK